MPVKLDLKRNIFSDKFFPYLFDYSKRWEVYMGSAGSGKSYFIAQKLIIRCCKEKIRVLVCRRTGTTLRNSTFSLFKEILSNWKILPYVKVKETDMSFTFPNGSEIIEIGLDEETKLLSLQNISAVWVEEAFEVPQKFIDQLDLRMRGVAKNQQIILSFNPISSHHWLYDFCEKTPPKSFAYIHSTYKDNPFLSKEYVESLEEIRIRNPQKARVYCDGAWGIDADGLVFQNFTIEEFDPMTVAGMPDIVPRNGMDIGWTDPTAIVGTLYDEANKTIYIYKEFYKSGCQLDIIAEAYKKMDFGKTKVYIDSADPRAIDFLRKEGINAEGSKKGKDSVKAGYMFLQNNKIIIHPDCKSVIMEFSNFSYKKSKSTGDYTEDTTHEFSHSIDACRYAFSDIYTNKKIKTFDKALLGL